MKWGLYRIVLDYIEAKVNLTECMQKHFRQVCHNCDKYFQCKVYAKYVDTWIELQNEFLELKDQENV